MTLSRPAPPAEPRDPRTRPSVTTARYRRPSGEPAPLPRGVLYASGRAWALAFALGAVASVAMLVPSVTAAVTRVDLVLLRALSGLRAGPGADLFAAGHALGSVWVVRTLLWGTVAALVVHRRWRHLAVLLGAFLVLDGLVDLLVVMVGRERPVGVEILGPWTDFAYPSRPVATFVFATVTMLYTLVPHGRARDRAKLLVAVLVAVLVASRTGLAVDHPTDALSAVLVGVTIPLVAFRLLTPHDVYPLVYPRGRAAHLALHDRRVAAIHEALRDQLGLRLRAVAPFNLEESFGSTPLRLELEDGTLLFGKLYAASHMRADRWYKLGRTLLYGRLEDERPFTTVRRLVQQEDYMLRVMRDAGLPVAAPHGFVELTPEREYMLVTEFIEGARESGDAEIDEATIDDALGVVRRMWECGLAHRDIKPANVLVRPDGRIALIDVFFGQIRPSPWRQAVDLGAMMIVLALRTDVRTVYDRALRLFTPDEVAEAFAATSEATRPSLHRMLRDDGRDLVAEFRSLAPPHPRIRVQRWSARRLGLSVAVLAGGVLLLVVLADSLRGMGML